jgi:hypothetical protein
VGLLETQSVVMRRIDVKARTERNSPTSTVASFRRRSGYWILLSGLALLWGCGGSSNSSNTTNGQLSGNWQFTNTALDSSLQGGIQGGFLLQKKNIVTGQFVYSFALVQPGTLCNSGTAAVTGTVSGQNVTLTAVAGVQTLTFSGTLSPDGKTLMGTYNSTDGQGCGTAQTGLQWSAVLVPPLNGAVQGNFHSTGGGVEASLSGQDFPVSGTLFQGPNTGASSATITGTLNFQGYSCLAAASVNGEISGNSVILQVIGTNGLNVGSIGGPQNKTTPAQVVLASAAGGGYVLRGVKGYALSTGKCPGGNLPGDVGNVCLGLGSYPGTQNDPTQFTNQACTQPITLTPAALSFPPQILGTPPTTQTFTLTNTDPSGGTVSGLQVSFRALDGSPDFTGSDFNGVPNFSEQDTCANPPGSTFSLAPQQSCTITAVFSPQQSCPWLPTTAAPSLCPPFLGSSVASPPALGARVSITTPASADGNTVFTATASGVGLSAIQPSTPELDFGSESLNGPGSAPQSVSFTNVSNASVQILPALNPAPCGNPGFPVVLPRPLVPGVVPGIQAVTQISSLSTTIQFVCDVDPVNGNPTFQIVSDSCTGTLLAPLQSCLVSVKFAPQPATQQLSTSFTFFLQLNTLQCTSTTTSDCEIDAGRFPVELRANLPSPLRMSPGAGLEFGAQPKGQISPVPLTVTLFNDPLFPDVNNPSPQTVHITGILVKGDYSELDNCFGNSLAPGSSCTLSVSFSPKTVGFDPGTLTITFNNGQVQTVFLRGTGQ